uniref:Reverse transcriptase zinc-binding domain-containing protein n=1 Tax=Nicotiana tabacum TaxID=4097 RepID=A0A1S4C6K8_TOBAC
MVGELRKVTWESIMYGNEARPKAVFITWLQQQDRLLTATRLESWGIQVENNCVMCKEVAETRDHLFAECAVGRQVWKKLMQWLQITWVNMSTWNQMQQWIEQNRKGKTVKANLVKMMFTEYVYAIWIERNNRLFAHKDNTCESMAREIAYSCHVRANSTTRLILQKYRFP